MAIVGGFVFAIARFGIAAWPWLALRISGKKLAAGLALASVLAYAAVFLAVVLFIGIHVPHANYGAAVALLAIASVSFIGVGMMTAVLPLISPEKGAQLGFIAQVVGNLASDDLGPLALAGEREELHLDQVDHAAKGILDVRRSQAHRNLDWDGVRA